MVLDPTDQKIPFCTENCTSNKFGSRHEGQGQGQGQRDPVVSIPKNKI